MDRHLMEIKQIRIMPVSYTHLMVDTNIQREDILPSEKAHAYKMKYEAMKHQGSKGEKHTADLVLSLIHILCCILGRRFSSEQKRNIWKARLERGLWMLERREKHERNF